MDIYKFVSSNDVTTVEQQNQKLCDDIYNKIYKEKHLFTNNYLAKLVINMFLPFFYRFYREDFNIDFASKFQEYEKFKKYVKFEPEYGTILKQYGLTNLTKKPIPSLILLNTCKDNIKYCPMYSARFISDNINDISYLCNEKNSSVKIHRIKSIGDLQVINKGDDTNQGTNDEKVYLYSMLPDETLCLFKGNHSTGSCGQPVICAGIITIKNNKIISIDNDSGHYMPPESMLLEMLRILISKGITSPNYKITKSGEITTKIIFVFE